MLGAVALSAGSVAAVRAPYRASEFTDRSYAWREGLAHYGEVHSVRLPAPVVPAALGTPRRTWHAVSGPAGDRATEPVDGASKGRTPLSIHSAGGH